MTVTILLDNYPEETTWQITDAGGTVIASGGPYGSFPDGSTVTSVACLDVDACYDFTIFDSYGDGICCGYGNGAYTVTDANNTYASGGSFGSSETTGFCVSDGSACTTTGQACDDGDDCTLGETYDANCNCNGGVYTDADGDGFCVGDDPNDNDPCVPDNSDCGGCDWEVVDNNTFENGWGIWNDGGSDCRRSSNDSNYANSGIYCVRLRDNNVTGTTTTDNLDLSSYEKIAISFTYYPRSMDNSNEDFWFQVSTNGGGTYTTIEEWNRGDEFENNIREFDDFEVNGPFTSNTRLRFRCDASGNSDWIYLDDVVISGYSCGANSPQGTVVEDFNADISIYPNPATQSETLRVEYSSGNEVNELEVFNLRGERILTMPWNRDTNVMDLPLNEITSGTYFMKLQTNQGAVTKKFIVID